MADKVLRWPAPSAAARPVDDGPLSDESDEEYDLLGINSNRTPRHDNFADKAVQLLSLNDELQERRRKKIVNAAQAQSSSSSTSSMIQAFSQKFALSLRSSMFGNDKTNNKTVAVGEAAAPSADAPPTPKRYSQKKQMKACREVATLLVGPSEELDLQRLAREHCKLPCETYRAAMLRGATAEATDLASVEAAAEAQAMAAIGGAGGGKGSHGGGGGGLSVGRTAAKTAAGEDPLVTALVHRVMRAIEANHGAFFTSQAQSALKRRPAVAEDVEKAAVLVRRLALHALQQKAQVQIGEAVTRARTRARAAAGQLLAPLPSPASEENRKQWGLKMLTAPPPPLTADLPPSLMLPTPERSAGGGTTPRLAARASSPSKKVKRRIEVDAKQESAAADLITFDAEAEEAAAEAKKQRARLHELNLHIDEYMRAYQEEFGGPPPPGELSRSVKRMQAEARRLARKLEGKDDGEEEIVPADHHHSLLGGAPGTAQAEGEGGHRHRHHRSSSHHHSSGHGHHHRSSSHERGRHHRGSSRERGSSQERRSRHGGHHHHHRGSGDEADVEREPSPHRHGGHHRQSSSPHRRGHSKERSSHHRGSSRERRSSEEAAPRGGGERRTSSTRQYESVAGSSTEPVLDAAVTKPPLHKLGELPVPPLMPWQKELERREGRMMSPSGSSKSKPPRPPSPSRKAADAATAAVDLSLDIEAGGTYSGGGLVPGFSSDEDDDDEYYGEEADANEHEQVGLLGGSQPSSAQSSSRSGLSSGPPSFNSRGRPDVRV